MLEIKQSKDNILEIIPHGTLHHNDFVKLGEKADTLLKEHPTLHLFIDASHFEGWDSLSTSSDHFHFIKDHHHKVEKVALIITHTWQQLIARALKPFLHPEVIIYTPEEIETAKEWIYKP